MPATAPADPETAVPDPGGAPGGSEYGAGQIRHLQGIEGIRLRPAMYIGGTDAVGLHHLVYELIDNVIDEFSNDYATRCAVTVNADGSLTVADDGRGIPVGRSDELGGRSALEVVFTEIHAGGKFDRASGYTTGTGGLHGIGITAVNACAEWLEAEVRREGHTWTMEFAKGRVTEDLQQLGSAQTTGTKVTFKPDAGDLRRRRLQLRDPPPPPAGRRLPQRRPEGEDRGRAHRPVRRVLLRGRPRGVRPLPQPHRNALIPGRDPLRRGADRRRGARRPPDHRRRRRPAISQRVQRADPLLRQRHL